MSVERYPADLVVTPQDFTDCGWKDVLDGTKRDGYVSLWLGFSNAARQAMEEDRQSQGKALWLLADACSMMLSPKSINEPFKPAMVMRAKRTVIPDDLSETDIMFFSQILDIIDDIWLKGRLADLVWLKKQPRDIKFAIAAIDSYRSIPLDTETWVSDGRECWERAIGLARMIRSGSGSRLKEIEELVVRALNSATPQDGYLGLWLADLLFDNGLGRDQRSSIALKLESLAREFYDKGDLHRAREYARRSVKWFDSAGNRTKTTELTVFVGESLVKEASARIATNPPNYMAASCLYEDAIQTYRTIPRSERSHFRVDERINELILHLNASGKGALGEFGVISAPPIDLSDVIEDARKAVHDKNTMDALKAFVGLSPGVPIKEMRENVIKRIKDFPLQALIPATFMSRDGRVIAKRPGMSLNDSPSDDDEIVIHAEMISDHCIMIGMTVQGRILPALEILLLEHRLREHDFCYLASQSPIVPPGRERLFGMALSTGYDRDFVTALHLLVPQIENMVRFHLQSAGVKTTTLDSKGIETENGLSTLMDLPECETIFGEDLTFEIQALFCDSFGPNLRNELAHGLLDDRACQNVYAIYAWWLGLKLVFNAFWNTAHKTTRNDREPAA